MRCFGTAVGSLQELPTVRAQVGNEVTPLAVEVPGGNESGNVLCCNVRVRFYECANVSFEIAEFDMHYLFFFGNNRNIFSHAMCDLLGICKRDWCDNRDQRD